MKKLGTADIAVIGGGAVGTAVAAYLARTGASVALIERGEFAWGSSRRCDGHAVTYDSPPGFFSRFCKMGIDLFPEIIPLLDVDIEFEPEGLGLLVDDEKDLPTVLETYEGKKKEGTPVVFWDRDELRRHEPHVADRVVGCLNFMADAKLNPMRLSFGLSRLAKKHGAKLYTNTTVTGFTLEKGAVTGIETNQGRLECGKVVVAAGVWTPLLCRFLDINVPIRPRQGHILVTERVSGLITKNYAEYGYLAAKGGKTRSGVTPAMEQNGVALVLEPSHAGTILAGSSRRFVGMDTNPDPVVMQAIAQRIMHFFPKFGDTRIIRCYAGLRPASPDGKPIISPTHVGGVYVASGHEGNGIGLSLISGKLVSEMLTGATPCIEMDALHLDRFSMNPPALAVER